MLINLAKSFHLSHNIDINTPISVHFSTKISPSIVYEHVCESLMVKPPLMTFETSHEMRTFSPDISRVMTRLESVETTAPFTDHLNKLISGFESEETEIFSPTKTKPPHGERRVSSGGPVKISVGLNV